MFVILTWTQSAVLAPFTISAGKVSGMGDAVSGIYRLKIAKRRDIQ